MDFRFTGGTLNNRAKWGTTFRPYYLDGLNPTGDRPTKNSASATYRTSRCYVIASNKLCFWSCLDSSFLPVVPNRKYAQDLVANAYVHSDLYGGGMAGKVSLRVDVTYAKPQTPVLLMTSLAGYTKGVNIGSRCNKLWLNPAAAVLIQALPAGGGQRLPPVTRFLTNTKFSDAWAGRNVWFQAGYTDSVTGRLNLTTAAFVRLPRKPVDVLSATRYAVYHRTRANGNYRGTTPSTLARRQPLFRYRYK